MEASIEDQLKSCRKEVDKLNEQHLNLNKVNTKLFGENINYALEIKLLNEAFEAVLSETAKTLIRNHVLKAKSENNV